MTDRLITPEGEALARKALAQIDANPCSFNQSTWGYRTECGTVACMAGHVILAAGGEVVPSGLMGLYRYQGEDRSAPDLARELLGVSYDHADALFQAANTREDLGAIVDALVAGGEAELDARAPYYTDDDGERGYWYGDED